MDGIFDLHIALLNGDKTFKIPIKWLPKILNEGVAFGFYDILKGNLFYKLRLKESDSFDGDADTQRLILEDYSKLHSKEIQLEKKDTYWEGTIIQ